MQSRVMPQGPMQGSTGRFYRYGTRNGMLGTRQGELAETIPFSSFLDQPCERSANIRDESSRDQRALSVSLAAFCVNCSQASRVCLLFSKRYK